MLSDTSSGSSVRCIKTQKARVRATERYPSRLLISSQETPSSRQCHFKRNITRQSILSVSKELWLIVDLTHYRTPFLCCDFLRSGELSSDTNCLSPYLGTSSWRIMLYRKSPVIASERSSNESCIRYAFIPVLKDKLVLQIDPARSQHAQSNASSHTSQPCCLWQALTPLRSSAGYIQRRA